MTAAQEYNKAIWELWKKHFKSAKAQPHDLIPLMYPEFPPRQEGKRYVLFVGSNPSFDEHYRFKDEKAEKHIEEIYSRFSITRKNAMSYSGNHHEKWKNIAAYAPELQKVALQYYHYFNSFKYFSGVEEQNLKQERYWDGDEYVWAHCDVLASRSTNESKVKDFLRLGNRDKFLKAQLGYWKKLVKNLKPDLIVVASAYARDLLQEHYPECKKVEKNAKYYHCLFEYPTVFLGMLTGQRAMDIGSRNLWEWYIPKLLDHLKTNKTP